MSGPDARGPRVVLLRNTFGNLGDLAMMEAELVALRDYLPSARVTVLSDDHRLERRFAGVRWDQGDLVLCGTGHVRTRERERNALIAAPRPLRAIVNRLIAHHRERHRASAIRRLLAAAASDRPERSVGLPLAEQRFISHLRSASVVIGGGGLLGRLPAVHEPRRAVYAALQRMRIPYILNGLSLVSDWKDDTYAAAELLVLRDRRASAERSTEYGADPGRCLFAVDPAFALVHPRAHDPHVLRSKFGVEPGRYLAVNLRQGEWTVGDSKALLERFAHQLCDLAIRFAVRRILLFPMQVFRENDDRVWVRALHDKLHRRVESQMVPELESPDLLRAIVSQAKAVVSCRYHGALFALGGGVPVLGLLPASDYDVKMRGLFAWYGLEHWCLRFDEALPDYAFHQFVDHHWTIRNRLNQINPYLVEDVEHAYERISAVIERCHAERESALHGGAGRL